MSPLLFTLLATILLPVVLSDTPANCSYEEIRGRWTFYVGPGGNDNTINCSESFTADHSFTLTLSYPDLVMDDKRHIGFWTMIYNQGFEVVIDKKKYFAFSNFTMVNKTAAVSHCDSTFNGWSHDTDQSDWACYFGIKEQAKAESRDAPEMKLDLDRKYVKNQDFIDEINARTKLWKAAHYPEMEGMTLGDHLHRAGGLSRAPFPKTTPLSDETLESLQALPEVFDWRDVGGTNYVSPIRNQLKCGSCYAFGSMAMLEARVRIMSKGAKQPVFSTQDIVSCSQYSQGCMGGFPYLIAGKYGEDFGVVEEECFPYTGYDNISCAEERPQCTRYHTKGYHYIGGYYGACNEGLMRLELVKNGPIAVSFEVTDDFHQYKSGIYHQTGLKDGFNPWEVTNHVVAIVGYGVENGVKYWTVKNSWGEQWGEQGFFRIMRGTDELNIESMAVAVTPILHA